MKKILLVLGLMLLSTLAQAQSARNPCYNNAGIGCTPVGTLTPLPEVPSFTGPSGTVQVSPTNPLPTSNISPESQGSLSFVNGQPFSLFVDDFGTGTLNTSTKWNRPTTGGGGNATAATNAVGQTTIGTGTTANGYSLLQSQRIIWDRNPGYNYFQTNINIPIPTVTNAYMLFGFATVPATPTAALPCTNAAAFQFGVNGKLSAVTCASGGSPQIIADLSVAQGVTPVATNVTSSGYSGVTSGVAGTYTGGCNCTPQISTPKSGLTITDSYKYVIVFRGDNILWYIEQPQGNLGLVAYTTRGAVGLDVNQVPITYLAVANTVGPTATATMQINQATVGDTAKNPEPGFDRAAYPTQALTTVNDAVGMNSMGAATCTFTTVSNTNVTLVFEATDPNGTNWLPVTGYPWSGGVGIQTVASGTNGAWIIPCAGFNQVRMRVSAVGATPTVLATATAGVGSSIIGPLTTDPCLYGAKTSAPINITTATTTALVAVSGTTTVYVCGFSLNISQVATTPNTLIFEYGSGAACVTSPVALTGKYGDGGVTAAAPITISYGDGYSTLFKSIAANGICALTAIGASASFQGVLTYVQQ